MPGRQHHHHQQHHQQQHHHQQHHHHQQQQQHRRRSSAAACTILNRFGFIFPRDFKLGSGRYSKVYKGEKFLFWFYTDAQRHFAIKVTDLQAVSTRFKQHFLPRELRIWRMLDHPNHVRLYRHFVKSRYLFEILDLADGGDMLNYMREHGPVEEAACRRWMLQLIDALNYLHQHRIAHRDLKLENILIFGDGVIKITDYGFCKQVLISADLSSTFCGTKTYKAPELLLCMEYNMFKVDIWSLGVVGFAMLTNKTPFHADRSNAEIVEAQRIHGYSYPPQLNLGRQCRSAIDTLLTFEPNDRPNIFECAKLPWFALDVGATGRARG
uniref:Protein kinase domain-containing protein n=1 Tax=Globodera pallida TaxID=36090 RepID=A0A183BHF9_GLOPA